MMITKPSDKALKVMGEYGHFKWTRVYCYIPEDADETREMGSRDCKFGHTDFDEAETPGRCRLRVVFDDGDVYWIPEDFLYEVVINESYVIADTDKYGGTHIQNPNETFETEEMAKNTILSHMSL